MQKEPFIAVRVGAHIICFILCLALGGTAAATQEKTAKRRFDRGRFEYEDENYEDAIKYLEEAIQLDPKQIDYRFYLGLSYEKLDQLKKSVAVYEEILRMDPEDARTLLQLSSVKSRQGKVKEGLRLLDRAASLAPDDPNIRFNLGIMQLKAGLRDEAAKSFDWVIETSAELRQPALYHLGLAYFEEQRYEKSRKAMSQAIELDPTSPYGKNARYFLEQMDQMIRARSPWYILGALSGNYDSNVTLEPLEGLGLVGPAPAQDKEDFFTYFRVEGGYRPILREEWEVGLVAGYNQTNYTDLTDNNLKWPVLSIYGQWRFKPLTFRLQYAYSYYWSSPSNDRRLSMNEVTSSFYFTQWENFRGELRLGYQNKNFLDGTPDADRFTADFVQYAFFKGGRRHIRAGYKFEFEDTELDYYLNQLMAGVNSSLGWELQLDISVRRIWYRFDQNPDFYGGERRKDKQWQADAQLWRPLGKYFVLRFAYYRTENRSNIEFDDIDIFDFDRNVYTLDISATF